MPIQKPTAWKNELKYLRSNRDVTSKAWSLIDAISAEIELYDKAFSPMAKRNIALGIHDKIVEIDRSWPKPYSQKPFPGLLANLDAAACAEIGITSSVGTDTKSAHKYEFATCIAFRVSTGKFDANVYSNSMYGKQYNIVEYDGRPSDAADYLQKISRMKAAIQAAFTLNEGIGQSALAANKALKIFMAPEFYFRGINGAYDIRAVSKIFDNLREFTSQARFSNWLFVFGTVIGASVETQMHCQNCNVWGAANFTRAGHNRFTCKTAGCPAGSVMEEAWWAAIDNVALVQKGGESGHENALAISKEYISHIDFRRAAPHTLNPMNLNQANLGAWDVDRQIEVLRKTYYARPPGGSNDVLGSHSRFADERMGGSIFTIDGIKFGIEICLDHLKNRIPPGAGLQVQLVPSAGASLQPAQVHSVLMPKGIAFNVDGATPHSDAWVRDIPNAARIPGAVSQPLPTGGTLDLYAPTRLPYP